MVKDIPINWLEVDRVFSLFFYIWHNFTILQFHAIFTAIGNCFNRLGFILIYPHYYSSIILCILINNFLIKPKPVSNLMKHSRKLFHIVQVCAFRSLNSIYFFANIHFLDNSLRRVLASEQNGWIVVVTTRVKYFNLKIQRSIVSCSVLWFILSKYLSWLSLIACPRVSSSLVRSRGYSTTPSCTRMCDQ